MPRAIGSPCDRYDLIVLPDDHVRESGALSLAVITYCDFEYPHCRQAYFLVSGLRTRFADHVRFVYRHFPLVKKHPHAQLAAEASEAAALQNRFWPMHDVLFKNQAHLENVRGFKCLPVRNLRRCFVHGLKEYLSSEGTSCLLKLSSGMTYRSLLTGSESARHDAYPKVRGFLPRGLSGFK